MVQDLIFDDDWPREALEEMLPLLTPQARSWVQEAGEQDLERLHLVIASCASAAMLLRTATPATNLSLDDWVDSVIRACDLQEAISGDGNLRMMAAQSLFFALAVEGLPGVSMEMFRAVRAAMDRLGCEEVPEHA